METFWEVVRYTSFWIGCVGWNLFTLIYGVTRKWQATAYGVNTFLVSLMLSLALDLIALAYIVPEWHGRDAVRIIIFLLVAATGVQRLLFLRKKEPS